MKQVAALLIFVLFFSVADSDSQPGAVNCRYPCIKIRPSGHPRGPPGTPTCYCPTPNCAPSCNVGPQGAPGTAPKCVCPGPPCSSGCRPKYPVSGPAGAPGTLSGGCICPQQPCPSPCYRDPAAPENTCMCPQP